MADAATVHGNCAPPTPTTVACMSLLASGSSTNARPEAGLPRGLGPEALRSAYKLPIAGGAGHTVTIVDAYDDPDAASDLAHYREQYALPQCSESSGCFRKFNQHGEEQNYPAANVGWSAEISLDLDMVSAVCPECHIRLVEANNDLDNNLFPAEDEAAQVSGTTVISNSWGAPETTSKVSDDSYFEHPGIPILVASGDYCYRNECEDKEVPNFPASAPSVIAVGGTQLQTASNGRGWQETTWYEREELLGTGSGCSAYQPKPSWETYQGCSNRVDNDVSAIGGCSSTVAVYDTYEEGGWVTECGTSVATPVMAGVEALSAGTAREEGAQAFWTRGPQGRLFDVTEGSNWYWNGCGSLLCTAGVGYDGPTGWGAPDGPLNGWTSQSTPNPSEGKEIQLNAVSCASRTFCEAVGYYLHASQPVALAEMWNGSTWSLQSVSKPNEGERAYSLSAVSCTAPSACTAVGYDESGHGLVTLAERWNGSSWAVEATPNASEAQSNRFGGVSCTSAISCVAVGSYVPSNAPPSEEAELPLAEVWNGSTWSVQSVPNPGTVGSALEGVSCTSSSACTAVGQLFNKNHIGPMGGPRLHYQLAERWSGSEWKVEPLPEPTVQGGLSGVSCPSASVCMAIGTSGSSAAIAERWEGGTWSTTHLVSPPEATTETVTSRGVACRATTECMVIGGYGGRSGTLSSGLAELWNGAGWTLEPPVNNGYQTVLFGVACTAVEECEAVGRHETSQNESATSLAQAFSP